MGGYMARRLPSQPPVLPGFTHIHILGSGGFADVFLFEQNMPRRQVAVKVLLSEVVNDQVRQMFQAEANLMAQLSSHPSILTVYQASVSADGRPYLVMEMCSSALTERYRRERLPVAEVLRIAVRIGSAIETAHRAGVLHRDIKPSNILLTAYGHPVLSDFGIASTLQGAETQEAIGMSIPWSAPEVLLGEEPGAIPAEVWSFAATVYSLLAGRSPFEIPGQSNKSIDLISRIGKAKVQPMGRPDAPPSLEQALQRGLARRPEDRPHSVLELVHELQTIESELGLPQTPIEVAMDDWAMATVSDMEDRTQIRGLSEATPDPARRRRSRSGTSSQSEKLPLLPRPASQRQAGAKPWQRLNGLVWWIVVASVLVIALAATAVYVLVRANSAGIPTVTDIRAQPGPGMIEFSWPDPGLQEGDSYLITSDDGEPSLQSSTTYVVDGAPGERMCIKIAVNRNGVTGASSFQKCAIFEQ